MNSNYNALDYSMMKSVLFPPRQALAGSRVQENLLLQKVIKFQPEPEYDLRKQTIVLFDFETTGLDSNEDEIIEIGAIKYLNGKVLQEYSTLVKPTKPISDSISKLCGITNQMVSESPLIADVWPEFLKFIDGHVLFAHNAEFDMSFVWSTGSKLGYQIHWPAICTLKMARALLPDLESKSLDALAKHYQLSFEARHRSIGDVKVTASVLEKFLAESTQPLISWKDFEMYRIERRGAASV